MSQFPLQQIVLFKLLFLCLHFNPSGPALLAALSRSFRARRRSGWLVFGLWLGVFVLYLANGLTFVIKLTGSWVQCVLSAEVQSCFSVRVWSFTAPSGEQEPCCYIMNTSWLTGIKPLCLAVWQTLWKVQHHVYGDSHNETFLCLLWSELMAFPLFQGGNS